MAHYDHLPLKRLWRAVAEWSESDLQATVAASLGFALSALLLAVPIIGVLVGDSLGGLAGAAAGAVPGLLAGDILMRRRPWRLPLILLAIRTSRRPGWREVYFEVPETETARAAQALRSAGFTFACPFLELKPQQPLSAPMRVGTWAGSMGESVEDLKGEVQRALDGAGIPVRHTGAAWTD